MNKTNRALAAFMLLLAGHTAFAQTTQPSTKPSPEQQAAIDAYNHLPTDQPSPKLNLAAFNKDGSPNPNFGKPDAKFMQMHKDFVERSKQPSQVLFVGDSITEGWKKGDKGPNGKSAKDIFAEKYGDKYQAANFGIGGDRTEHVLWRIANGELDGFADDQPKVVVVMIGTNDSAHTPEEIAAGTTAVVKAIETKLPKSKILLLGIFPRAEKPTDVLRQKMAAADQILMKLDDGQKVKYLEIWKQFLEPDETLSKEIMPDRLHPNGRGYQIWADAMDPVLESMLK